jgi:hypothetical protein
MNQRIPQREQVVARTITVAFPEQFLIRKVLITFIALLISLLLYAGVSAQTVTELITDYNGYWKSNKTAINPVKPDNSHNLLAFSFNGKRYSTGVNDALLTTKGDAFIPVEYKALPVYQISGAATSDTKIGLGAMYDGVYNGASNPKPANNMNKYLTDGVNGLDLGTCVANLPAGTITFPVSDMKSQQIGDGIPDLLITQVADPSGSSLDKYEFADANGNRVGNSVDITLSSLSSLGKWTADFYNVNSTPMTLDAGFAQTDRELRLWAADFSAFGINSSNIGQIVYFRIRLNGNSDVAFVAYNNKTFSIGNSSGMLPTKLNYFKGSIANQQVTLSWQTVTEQQMDKFVIESSYDGQSFFTLDSVKAAGFSNTAKNYSYTQRNPRSGKIYYRLKQVDQNGDYEYSSITMVNSVNDTYTALSVYPNPVANTLTVRHQLATGQEQCTIHNMQGVVMAQKTLKPGTIQSSFDVQHLAAGAYMVVVSNGKEKYTEMLLKK